MKSSLLFLCVLFLAGCSSLPKELASSQTTTLIEYDAFVTAAKNDETAEVRLGGVIARIDNLKDTTRIEIVNLPISSSGKPDLSQEPNGRFVVYLNGFVDPVTYSVGRLVTVLGLSTVLRTQMLESFCIHFL